MTMFKKGDLVRHDTKGLATVEKNNGRCVTIVLKDGKHHLSDYHLLTLENAA